MTRPFRVELNAAQQNDGALTADVGRILAELAQARERPDAHVDATAAIAMWSGVSDIQDRLDRMKADIAELHAKGFVGGDSSRATSELRAVVDSTETATDAILAAAESIDGIAQRALDRPDEDARSDAREIADRVTEIYEACNFQDIAGQRVSKVVASLQFIEERIATMVEVWQTLDPRFDPALRPGKEPNLLNGPALKGDPDVVTQDDVDAMFR